MLLLFIWSLASIICYFIIWSLLSLIFYSIIELLFLPIWHHYPLFSTLLSHYIAYLIFLTLSYRLRIEVPVEMIVNVMAVLESNENPKLNLRRNFGPCTNILNNLAIEFGKQKPSTENQ